MKPSELIEKARYVIHYQEISPNCTVGEVGVALVTESGNVYTGVSLDASSGLGFCGEKAAVAQMLTAGETRIAMIVANSNDGKIMPPCGVCRELLYVIDYSNLETIVILGESKQTTLRKLLPERWQELWQ